MCEEAVPAGFKPVTSGTQVRHITAEPSCLVYSTLSLLALLNFKIIPNANPVYFLLIEIMYICSAVVKCMHEYGLIMLNMRASAHHQ